MATINHKTYNEATETFKDFNVYDGKETLIFKVDGSEGNVGIGTSSPSSMLTLNGITPFIRIERTGVPTWQIQNNTLLADAGFSINNLTNAGTPFFINGTTNNVGIGTVSPAVPLHACSPSLNSDIAVFTSSGNTSRGLKISTFNSGNNDAGVILNAQTSLGAIAFQATGTEIARITSNGLTFNGDTAAANALDDYEEGTFTPTFLPTVGGFDSITYSVQYGKYTKIGNRVDINIQITCSSVSVGAAGGVLSVVGLPYTVGAKVCPVSLAFISNWLAGRFPIRAAFNDGGTNVLMRYVTALNANETYLAGADIQANSSITIMGTYFV